jgi:Xaa-Pro dipeptidase
MRRRDFLKTTATGALAPLAVSPGLGQSTNPKNPKADEIRSRIKPITDEERKQRIENARKIMTDQNIDAMFFEGGASLNYFTGVNWGRSERLFAMVLPRNGNPVFIAPLFEESRAREQIGKTMLYAWQEHDPPYAALKVILKDNNMLTGVLGIEETTRYFVTENIGLACPGVELINGTVVTAGCRSIKTAHEIELMQIANDITAEVFKAAVPKLKEGMTEREFGSVISKGFSEFGVSGGALVLFGEASAHPHGLEKQQTLQKNQIVLIDGGCSVEGYASDVTRTIIFGKPTEKMLKVFDIVRKAQSKALAAAKPNVSAESVDFAARRLIIGAGYGPDYKYFTHRLGHGIGMEGHEWYYLVPGSKRLLQTGNMYSNEPGIYIPGEFGIRLEDEMLITENGSKLLLPQAKNLETMF